MAFQIPRTELQRVIIDKLRVTFPAVIPMLREASLHEHMNHLYQELCYQLDAFIAAKTHTDKRTSTRVVERITIPLTWWDHLKLQHAPAWFLSRWPARTRTIEVTVVKETTTTTQNICPHIDMPPGNIKHFEVLTRGSI